MSALQLFPEWLQWVLMCLSLRAISRSVDKDIEVHLKWEAGIQSRAFDLKLLSPTVWAIRGKAGRKADLCSGATSESLCPGNSDQLYSSALSIYNTQEQDEEGEDRQKIVFKRMEDYHEAKRKVSKVNCRKWTTRTGTHSTPGLGQNIATWGNRLCMLFNKTIYGNWKKVDKTEQCTRRKEMALET